MPGSINQKPLDWLTRLQVAEDAAKGLDSNLTVVGNSALSQISAIT